MHIYRLLQLVEVGGLDIHCGASLHHIGRLVPIALTSILSVVQLMVDLISSLVLLDRLFVLWADRRRVDAVHAMSVQSFTGGWC